MNKLKALKNLFIKIIYPVIFSSMAKITMYVLAAPGCDGSGGGI